MKKVFGGEVMSKADELLNRHLYRKEDDKKLWGETLNYLNRKDKLVEGSEWVCDVGCYAFHCDTGMALKVAKGFHAKVLTIGSSELIFEYPDECLRIVTIDQFLACFVPKDDM